MFGFLNLSSRCLSRSKSMNTCFRSSCSKMRYLSVSRNGGRSTASSYSADAERRSHLVAGFFAAASFASLLPSIDVNISFWPAGATSGSTLYRSACIRSTTFSPLGRSFGPMALAPNWAAEVRNVCPGQAVISQIENGRSNPTLLVLEQLADAMQVKVPDLVEAPSSARRSK